MSGQTRPVARALAQARRVVLEQALSLETVGIPRDPRPTLLAANHAARIDRRVVSAAWPTAVVAAPSALRFGVSALVFPEGGVTPDGTLGHFRAEAFGTVRALWEQGSDVTITPIAVVGTFGLDRELPWWRSQTDQAAVRVRVGEPIGPTSMSAHALAEVVRDRVAALLCEDATTWWQQVRDPAPAGATAGPSWRHAWANSRRSAIPGRQTARKIWG